MKATIPGLILLASIIPGGIASAAPTVFYGADVVATSTSARPNSSAAASRFDVAVSALSFTSIITFESSPIGAFNNIVVAPDVTLTGADYSGAAQTIRNSPIGTNENVHGYNTTLGGANFVNILGGSLTFRFTQPVNYFGAYLSGIQLTGETLQFDDGTSQVLTLPSPSSAGGLEFFGFTDEGKAISQITINADTTAYPQGDDIGVDDVRYGTASIAAVPEPTALTILSSGVVGLLAARRRRIR